MVWPQRRGRLSAAKDGLGMMHRVTRMRLAGALVVALAIAAPALAREYIAAATEDFVLPLAPLPEVEVVVPSDRTEFSSPGGMIAPPDLPEVTATLPGRAPEFAPPAPSVAVAPPPLAQPLPPASAPAPASSAPRTPRVIAIAPPPAPPGPAVIPPASQAPVASAPAAPALAAPVPPPPPVASAPPALEMTRAFDALAGLSALPPASVEAIRGFYLRREGKPLFAAEAGLSAQGEAVLRLAARAEEHGLDPRRFARLSEAARSGEAALREAAVAALAALYARDARGGRINPQAVSRLITAAPRLPDVAVVLETLSVAPDVAATLESWNPGHAGYRGLKVALAAARAPDQTAIPAKAIGDLIANMERWRWLPAELGDDHVFVNIPAYHLEFVRNGRTAFETRVVVGKPQTQTPIFSDRIQYLAVNPYWNVPPSIALKEYLPLLQKNPYALQARGLEVVDRGRLVDPATVDWTKIGRSVAIRQPPGERNALGHIKIMFPNQHAVYLHDTPSRSLFGAARRAYSHGCVRVQNPFALAAALMGPGWSEGRLRGMVGGPERQIGLPEHIPVHLTYFTAEAAADGTLRMREDIYGHNRRLRALLGV